MRMIPDRPFNTKSNAEKKIFDVLKECFIGDNGFVAFHSLDLTDHERKRIGEVDFLILCKYGVFAFEVKGGRISCEQGKWFTSNSRGKNELKEDPFKQAKNGLEGLIKKIKKNNKLSSLFIPHGHGVVFPDCIWDQQGAEWDRPMISDAKNVRNFEQWLNKFFKYWKNKSKLNSLVLQAEDIKQLRGFLRPNFELVESLYDKILVTEEQTVKLTEDQYLYVDIAMENQRVICSGGAGTGKTFLAAEIARRKGATNKEVLFVCRSPWLKNYLSTRIVSENITITTIDGVKQSIRRAGLDNFDVLIVDEGQDLFNFDDLDILDFSLDNGLENGEWYIFHDINNQSDLFLDANVEVLTYITSLNNAAKFSLRTNCRNTQHILLKVQESLFMDMGNNGTGEGPEVSEVCLPRDQLINSLANKINELLKFDIEPSSITVLSALPFNDSIISFLPDKIKNLILELDDYSVRNFPHPKITFSQIKNFKGLENEVILLVDLPSPYSLTDSDNKTLHYVGMSRARGLLCAFWAKIDG